MNFPGGMQKMMQEMNRMQARMAKLQEELAEKFVEASSGGGAVKVEASGTQQIKSIIIAEDVMKAGDVSMLQDLVLTAVNDVMKKSKKMSEEEMSKITGGMKIPGMF